MIVAIKYRLLLLAILTLMTGMAFAENNVYWGPSALVLSGGGIKGGQIVYQHENVVFEWDTVTGADSYEICIGAEDVAGSGNVVGENCHVVAEGTSYTIRSIDLCNYAPGTQVWARVRSLLTAGVTQYNVSPWSDYIQITCSESPTAPEPTTTTSTVAVADYVPNPFSFDSRTGAEVSTGYSSGLASMSGINVPATITITQSGLDAAEFSINGGAWSSSDTTISNGSTLAISLTSSPNYSVARCATVTVNGATLGVTGTYRVTTKTEPTTTTTAAGSTTTTTQPAACQSGTYMFAYNGDYTEDTDEACFTSGADHKTGSLGATASCTTDYCTILYTANTFIKWVIADNDGINPSEGTLYFSLYYTDDDSNSTHGAGIVFEASDGTNTSIIYGAKLATVGKIRFYYIGGGVSNNVTNADSLSFNTWYRVGITWDYNDANQDYMGIDIEPEGTAIDWDEASPNVAKTMSGMTGSINALNFGESVLGTTSGDGMYIRNVVILSGYQADDIF